MNKKLLVIMLVILIVISLLGVGAFFLIKHFNQEDAQEQEQVELSIEEVIAYSVDTQMITTNLLTDNYARVQFRVQGTSEEGKAEIEKRLFQIENIIIRILANKNAPELSGREAIEALEITIKDEINNLIDSEEDLVEKVYATTLMVQ